MRHLVDRRKLGRTASHRKALLRNMVTSLILSERIETTLPKAKELRSLADRMITWGKQGDLAARRQAARVIRSDKALSKLFDGGLAKRFEDRAGGYTRVLKFGQRGGDAADMALIEFVGYQPPEPGKRPEKKIGKKVEKKAAPKKVEKRAKTEEKKVDKPAPKKEKKGWGLFRRAKKPT